ncbi:Uncharacterized protein FWK35_00035720 [Aphis craccivora]|uniref:Pre-C2HC domain-containing protein n=1 Tax=Aphis craccivora TaxID=307492 RepID=A0A6G0VWI3_APHCR|nr:Uncharacterized protein FWK35_00035720 [Aphis craccivora]
MAHNQIPIKPYRQLNINIQNVIKQKNMSTNSNKRSLPASPTTSTMPPNELKKTNLFASPNRYSAFAEVADDNVELTDTTTSTPMKVSLPPPIFIKGVLNYSDLLSELTELIGLNSFIYKSYRLVLRNLHPTTPITDISSAIEEIVFSTRQVINIKHHLTKTALPMSFVDLESDPSNKDIFNVKSLLHTIVKIEEPHKRRDIPQSCKKTPDTPATCALSNGNHPANYKSCSVHKELQNRRRQPSTSINPNQNSQQKQPAPPSSSPASNLQSSTHHKSYANVTGNDTTHNQSHNNHAPINDIDVFSKFLDELKSVINPLITLLTSVISKLLDTKLNG